jgi:hypothetical protein
VWTQKTGCDLDSDTQTQIYLGGKCELKAILQREAKSKNISRAAAWTLVRERPAVCEYEQECEAENYEARVHRINQSTRPCQNRTDCFTLTDFYTPRKSKRLVESSRCSGMSHTKLTGRAHLVQGGIQPRLFLGSAGGRSLRAALAQQFNPAGKIELSSVYKGSLLV